MSTNQDALVLTFGQAMDKGIIEGLPVACELWHGEEKVSFNKSKKRVAEGELWNPLNKEVARRHGGYATNLPYSTKISHDCIQMGWQPSQEEMFAKWHLADVRHLLDSVSFITNPRDGSIDLKLHFFPYNLKAISTPLPYSELYQYNMLGEYDHVVFASNNMLMNVINCLIYDSAFAFYNSRFITSGYNGFVLKDHMSADGSWKDLLQCCPSKYTLVDTSEDGLERLTEALGHSSILIADKSTVEPVLIQTAIGHADNQSEKPIGVSWTQFDFKQQIELSVEPKDFVE